MPYESHTNRELEFMLKKGKPLAHFCDYYPSEPTEEIIPELAFAPYVIQGTFVKREYIELLSGTHRPGDISIKGVRHVLYARANEAWRIDAFIAMKGAAAIVGWNIGFERLEGMLLGYEEWQSEEHLAKLKANDHTSGWYWLKDAK